MNVVLQTWRKNIKWIILVAFFVGLALSVEKIFFTDTITKSDRFYVEQEVSIKYVNPTEIGNIIDYQNLFSSFTVLNRFLEETKDDYDYSKWDADFPGMMKEKQLEWLKKHLLITNVGNTACVYSFNLPANTRKNDQYVEEYGQKFLKQYIEFTQRELNQMGMSSSYQLRENFTLQPTVITVNNKVRALKYGVAGFILGALLAMLVLGIRRYFQKDK